MRACVSYEAPQKKVNLPLYHKIVHNYVAHNANMKKWNMKENEHCKYCKEKETILHLYANCPEIVKLLKQVLRALRKNCMKVIDFIFGNTNKAETLMFLIISRFHGTELNA